MKYYRAFSLFIIIIINTFLYYYVDACIGGNGGGGLGAAEVGGGLGAAEDDGPFICGCGCLRNFGGCGVTRNTKVSCYAPSCPVCRDLKYQKNKPGC